MTYTLVQVGGWAESKAHVLLAGDEKTLCNRVPKGAAGTQAVQFPCHSCLMRKAEVQDQIPHGEEVK
jgi:hypothetical protein